MECTLKGCHNKKSKGKFIGDICNPCYKMITTGEIEYGSTFIHQIKQMLSVERLDHKEHHRKEE